MWYLTVIFKHLVGVLSQIGTESNKFSRHVTLDWCFEISMLEKTRFLRTLSFVIRNPPHYIMEFWGIVV
jgi:hypothetical protein